MSEDEGWRMSRAELHDLLLRYEKAVEEDAYNLLRPTARERKLLGEALLRRRADAVRRARDANRRFVEVLVQDLPDLCSPPGPPPRPFCAVRCPEPATPTLPTSSYGSLSSLLLHLLRDWSPSCAHVGASTYGPAVEELQRLLPSGEVLVPGCGLGRLAVELAAAGYRVEANDASRLFLTAMDWVINRPPEATQLFPMAHVFSENWSHDQQYHEVALPAPTAADLLQRAGAGAAAEPLLTLVPGDFVKSYGRGGSCHRKFNAIVTCFFLDTVTDLVELMDVLDGLLEEGGVWVNVGPLNFKKEARLKLTWDEIVVMWENLGYEFKTQKRSDVDYHLPRGEKMYTESYQCSLTAAVKGPRPVV